MFTGQLRNECPIFLMKNCLLTLIFFLPFLLSTGVRPSKNPPEYIHSIVARPSLFLSQLIRKYFSIALKRENKYQN